MKNRFTPIFQGLTALALITCAYGALADEPVGTSTADAPSYAAKLTIENNSPVTVAYQLKWGNGAWKTFKIVPGQTWGHSIPINDQNRYPVPHLTFNSVTDFKGHVVATKAYKLEGYKVGYNGYGAKSAYLTTPKRYEFTGSISRSSTMIDLKSKN